MRSDKQKRFEQFISEIEDVIAKGQSSSTVSFEGFQWANLPQPVWCERVGVSGPTLRDLAKHPPIVATKTVNGAGVPIVLYRIGEAAHQSFRHIANQMAIYFRNKWGLKRIASKHWGCLHGLAETWPQGHQLAIFKTAVSNWDEFMGGVGFCESDEDQELHAGKYYKYASIPIIRKYPEVAVEMYVMRLQKDQSAIPWILVKAMKDLGPPD